MFCNEKTEMVFLRIELVYLYAFYETLKVFNAVYSILFYSWKCYDVYIYYNHKKTAQRCSKHTKKKMSLIKSFF